VKVFSTRERILYLDDPMNEQVPESLGGGLAYEDWLPLKWSVVRGEPPLAALSHIHDANEKFLRRVAALEEEPSDITETHPELVEEFLRIESKLYLMLDMVGAVLARHLKLPKPSSIRLMAESISWISDKVPRADSHVLIELYLLSNYPYPLTFLGRVQSVEKSPEGRRITVVFDEMGEGLRDWLEKTIFRHHRRQIALLRRSHQTHDGHI
jgi:hypothetical protein